MLIDTSLWCFGRGGYQELQHRNDNVNIRFQRDVQRKKIQDLRKHETNKDRRKNSDKDIEVNHWKKNYKYLKTIFIWIQINKL